MYNNNQAYLKNNLIMHVIIFDFTVYNVKIHAEQIL